MPNTCLPAPLTAGKSRLSEGRRRPCAALPDAKHGQNTDSEPRTQARPQVSAGAVHFRTVVVEALRAAPSRRSATMLRCLGSLDWNWSEEATAPMPE